MRDQSNEERLCADTYLDFYINSPIGAVTVLPLVIIRVPNAQQDAGLKVSFRGKLARLDPLGSALFAAVIIMLLMAINWGGVTYPWSSSRIIGLLCGSGATFLLFLLWEHRMGEAAMLPLHFFRDVKSQPRQLQAFYHMVGCMSRLYTFRCGSKR